VGVGINGATGKIKNGIGSITGALTSSAIINCLKTSGTVAHVVT
jgi:hypothetical protein